MNNETIRVGIVGAGANTRSRHIPGLLEQEGVEIVSVCNRRSESTAKVAEEYGIPNRIAHWPELVADRSIHAVVVGTWPYMHAPVTIAALDSGKHVLCEARMARNFNEARAMYEAHERHPDQVAQIVPSPLGFAGDRVMKRLIADGYPGRLLEVHVYGMTGLFADPKLPLHWRQSAKFSGNNVLSLGILHETAMRWISPVVEVFAQTHRCYLNRVEPDSGKEVEVGTPDNVQVLTRHEDGARGVYQFSGVVHHGPGHGICLYGSDGTLKYEMGPDRISGGQAGDDGLQEIAITLDERYDWRVEAEFISAIRGEEPVEFTDFSTGLDYMAFTDAVHESAKRNQPVAVEKHS